jgi:AAA domain/DnaB-like helicase N terminal domain
MPTPTELMPHNKDAEQGLLSAILQDPRSHAVFDMLNEEDFYSSDHEIIYAAAQSLFHEDKAVDFVTVGEHLKEQGILNKFGQYLHLLTNTVPLAENAIEYAKIIRQKSLQRQAAILLNNSLNACLSGNGNFPGIINQFKKDFQELVAKNGYDDKYSARTFSLAAIGNLELHPPDHLIHDLLEKNILAQVFGDPACGKSFIGIDIACSLASGQDFHGYEVEQGPVIYIAGEGQQGILRRFLAWCNRYKLELKDLPIHLSMIPAMFCDRDSIDTVCKAIEKAAEEIGPPVLIVVDTVARNFGPGDENSTQDMTAFIAAADRIRALYNSTVLLIHHSGHGDKSRGRGAIALKGALDTEYRLTKDIDGIVLMECTKMKDSEPPAPMAFKIRPVELPIEDRYGDQVTSAILEQVNYEASPGITKRRSKWQTVAADILKQLYAEHRKTLEDGGFDSSSARVSVQDWKAACYQSDMPRSAWKRLMDNPPRWLKIEYGYAELRSS